MTRLFARVAALMLALWPMGAAAQSADVLLNCPACHTVGPEPHAQGLIFPDLRGQPIRYLENQLRAFVEGDRQHRQMQLTAEALDKGRGAMARMYADAPRPDLVTEPANAVPDLVMQGDWARGLPPCASCHALSPGSDRSRTAPRLHGQPESYLASQLRAYAEGTRRSDPMGRMRAFAGRLNDPEIADLARYYAGWTATETRND